MSSPVLSIIIPLFNSAFYIKKTINNILNAHIDSRKIEIMLVDDGSQDDTATICKGLAKQFPFLRYYKKENGGIASARNFGLKKAEGKYIFFHDHDDLFNAINLEKILKLIDSKESDLFLFSVNKIEDGVSDNFYILDDNFCDRILCKNEVDYVFKTMFFIEGKEKRPSNRFGHLWSVIVSRSFVNKHNISFETICDYEDDFTFLLKILINKGSIYCSNLTAYSWVINSKSESHNIKYDPEYLIKVRKYINYLDKVISKSIFSQLKRMALSNIRWRKNRDFLINYFFSNNHNRSYREFKYLCKKYDVRKSLISKTYFRKSKNQVFITISMFFKMYKLLYKIMLRKSLKNNGGH